MAYNSVVLYLLLVVVVACNSARNICLVVLFLLRIFVIVTAFHYFVLGVL